MGRGRPAKEAPGGDRLEGRNVVIEALKAGRALRWIRIDERARPNEKLDELRALAAKRGIAITPTPRDRLDALSVTGTHNGVIAEAEPVEPVSLGRLLERLRAGERAPWLVALAAAPAVPDDVGAVLRTADAVGVDAVVLPGGEGPLLSPGARRVAMGAAEHLPLARSSLTRALVLAREAGLRAVLALPKGDAPIYSDTDLTGPLFLVLAESVHVLPDDARPLFDATVSVAGDPPDRTLPLSALAAVTFYERERQVRRLA